MNLFDTYNRYAVKHSQIVRKYQDGGTMDDTGMSSGIAGRKARMLANLSRPDVKQMLDRIGPTEFQKMRQRIIDVKTTDPNGMTLLDQIDTDMKGLTNMNRADKGSYMNKSERTGGGYSTSPNRFGGFDTTTPSM